MVDVAEAGDPVSIQEWNPSIVGSVSVSDPIPGPDQELVFKKIVDTVNKNNTETIDYVIPSGKTLLLKTITGSLFAPATPSSDFYASLTWDADGTPEILDYVRGFSFSHPLSDELVGDGAKILRLIIHNETSKNTISSCRWIGFLEDT